MTITSYEHDQFFQRLQLIQQLGSQGYDTEKLPAVKAMYAAQERIEQLDEANTSHRNRPSNERIEQAGDQLASGALTFDDVAAIALQIDSGKSATQSAIVDAAASRIAQGASEALAKVDWLKMLQPAVTTLVAQLATLAASNHPATRFTENKGTQEERQAWSAMNNWLAKWDGIHDTAERFRHLQLAPGGHIDRLTFECLDLGLFPDSWTTPEREAVCLAVARAGGRFGLFTPDDVAKADQAQRQAAQAQAQSQAEARARALEAQALADQAEAEAEADEPLTAA